jgi:hypothetical protein
MPGVGLVDADSQGTSSTWSDARKEKDVPQVPGMTLRGRKQGAYWNEGADASFR